MSQSEDSPVSSTETPNGLRDLARRARRLARYLRPDDEGTSRLLGFAEELEARALALETLERQEN